MLKAIRALAIASLAASLVSVVVGAVGFIFCASTAPIYEYLFFLGEAWALVSFIVALAVESFIPPLHDQDF